MEIEKLSTEEDIYKRFVDEIVIVTRGKNKGRIGYCDDTASDKTCYINFGDPLITLHYEVIKASGNLKLAQALARHENIQIAQRYAHLNDDELDKGNYEIFEKK